MIDSESISKPQSARSSDPLRADDEKDEVEPTNSSSSQSRKLSPDQKIWPVDSDNPCFTSYRPPAHPSTRTEAVILAIERRRARLGDEMTLRLTSMVSESTPEKVVSECQKVTPHNLGAFVDVFEIIVALLIPDQQVPGLCLKAFVALKELTDFEDEDEDYDLSDISDIMKGKEKRIKNILGVFKLFQHETHSMLLSAFFQLANPQIRLPPKHANPERTLRIKREIALVSIINWDTGRRSIKDFFEIDTSGSEQLVVEGLVNGDLLLRTLFQKVKEKQAFSEVIFDLDCAGCKQILTPSFLFEFMMDHSDAELRVYLYAACFSYMPVPLVHVRSGHPEVYLEAIHVFKKSFACLSFKVCGPTTQLPTNDAQLLNLCFGTSFLNHEFALSPSEDIMSYGGLNTGLIEIQGDSHWQNPRSYLYGLVHGYPSKEVLRAIAPLFDAVLVHTFQKKKNQEGRKIASEAVNDLKTVNPNMDALIIVHRENEPLEGKARFDGPVIEFNTECKLLLLQPDVCEFVQTPKKAEVRILEQKELFALRCSPFLDPAFSSEINFWQIGQQLVDQLATLEGANLHDPDFIRQTNSEQQQGLLKLLSDLLQRENLAQLMLPEILRESGLDISIEHLLRSAAAIFNDSGKEASDAILADFGERQASHGQPIELIDGDNLCLNPIAKQVLLTLLESSPGVLVVSVVGPQSTGKSTLLNCIFGTNFLTAAGRCTKGVYASLMSIKEASGCSRRVLLLDTEGIQGFSNRDPNFDKRIVYFVLRMSHVVLALNSTDFNESMKNTLQLVADGIQQSTFEVGIGKPFLRFVHNRVTDLSSKFIQEKKEALEIFFGKDCDTLKGAVDDFGITLLGSAFNAGNLKNQTSAIQFLSPVFISSCQDIRTDVLGSNSVVDIQDWLTECETLWKHTCDYQELIEHERLDDKVKSRRVSDFINEEMERQREGRKDELEALVFEIRSNAVSLGSEIEVKLLLSSKLHPFYRELAETIHIATRDFCDLNKIDLGLAKCQIEKLKSYVACMQSSEERALLEFFKDSCDEGNQDKGSQILKAEARYLLQAKEKWEPEESEQKFKKAFAQAVTQLSSKEQAGANAATDARAQVEVYFRHSLASLFDPTTFNPKDTIDSVAQRGLQSLEAAGILSARKDFQVNPRAVLQFEPKKSSFLRKLPTPWYDTCNICLNVNEVLQKAFSFTRQDGNNMEAARDLIKEEQDEQSFQVILRLQQDLNTVGLALKRTVIDSLKAERNIQTIESTLSDATSYEYAQPPLQIGEPLYISTKGFSFSATAHFKAVAAMIKNETEFTTIMDSSIETPGYPVIKNKICLKPEFDAPAYSYLYDLASEKRGDSRLQNNTEENQIRDLASFIDFYNIINLTKQIIIKALGYSEEKEASLEAYDSISDLMTECPSTKTIQLRIMKQPLSVPAVVEQVCSRLEDLLKDIKDEFRVFLVKPSRYFERAFFSFGADLLSRVLAQVLHLKAMKVAFELVQNKEEEKNLFKARLTQDTKITDQMCGRKHIRTLVEEFTNEQRRLLKTEFENEARPHKDKFSKTMFLSSLKKRLAASNNDSKEFYKLELCFVNWMVNKDIELFETEFKRLYEEHISPILERTQQKFKDKKNKELTKIEQELDKMDFGEFTVLDFVIEGAQEELNSIRGKESILEIDQDIRESFQNFLIGCRERCPLCSLECDVNHTESEMDPVHRCQSGHQLMSFCGSIDDVDEQLILLSCGELDDKMKIYRQNNPTSIAKFKQVHYDWNFEDPKDNLVQAKQIWNNVGQDFCRVLNEKENGRKLRFRHASFSKQKLGSEETTHYIQVVEATWGTWWWWWKPWGQTPNLKQFIKNLTTNKAKGSHSKLSLVRHNNSGAKEIYRLQPPSFGLDKMAKVGLLESKGNSWTSTERIVALEKAYIIAVEAQEQFDKTVIQVINNGDCSKEEQENIRSKNRQSSKDSHRSQIEFQLVKVPRPDKQWFEGWFGTENLEADEDERTKVLSMEVEKLEDQILNIIPTSEEFATMYSIPKNLELK